MTDIHTLIVRLNVEAEIINHDHASGKTSENARRALGEPIERLIKCLLFLSRDEGSRNSVVGTIVTGDRRVNLERLQRVSGYGILRLASPEDVHRITGFGVGAVPPIILSGICVTYVDKRVLAQPYVIGSAGTEFAGLKIEPKEFLKIGYIPRDFAV